MKGLQYFFTKYGEVYAGWKWEEMNFPEFTFVIQGTKLKEYSELNHTEKTLEKISEYGWVLGNEVIVGTLDGEAFEPPRKSAGSYRGFNHDIEHKTMFIFGAGASANCVYGNDKIEFQKDDLQPPLGPALFEKRFKNYYNKYKGVRQSLPLLQSDENPDVEELFEREWKNIHKENNQVVLSRHISIFYYLQELLKEVSNRITNEYDAKNLYAKLGNKLQKIYSASVKTTYGRTTAKNFAFVSFNQDTILETFISQQFNIPLNNLNDYIKVNESPCYIFKPHGSWNWGWRFPDTSKFNGNTSNWLFENNINLFQLYFELLGDHTTMIDGSTWGYETMLNKHHLGRYTIDKSQLQLIGNEDLNNFFPALLLPYRDKDEFTMPLQHFNYMTDYFGSAETLVIIGWKGNEDAFNRQLFQKANRINKVIIADPNPDLVEKYLDPILSRPGVRKLIYKNFEDFVENGIDNNI
jgi:hypothetical protein